MASYAWVITEDKINGLPGDSVPSRKGTAGPHDAPDNLLSSAQAGDGRKFRMLDDDGEVYYLGVYAGPDDEDMFGPLWDFGAPDAGATEIQYREDGKWVTL